MIPELFSVSSTFYLGSNGHAPDEVHRDDNPLKLALQPRSVRFNFGPVTAQHFASWVGLCQGSQESAGKRKSGKIRKGNLWLRHCLCQGAWAVSTKKNNYLSALYRRLAVRSGSKRATICASSETGSNPPREAVFVLNSF